MRNGKYLLAIPAFNEDRHVARMVRSAKRYIQDILVVDDGSTDATEAVLRDIPDISVIRHRHNLGYGASLRDTFDYAIGTGYEWLLTMDCDEQHEPSAIPGFIAVAEEGEADIVSGSRYLLPPEEGHNAPKNRRIINARITKLLNRCLGLGLTDAFCGFKAYRTESLGKLPITLTGYAMPLQLWVQAARAGLRIVEFPVRLIYNDPMRRFGGGLDDAAVRYTHYLNVLNAELTSAGYAPLVAARPACHVC